jgi:hypothetical protein
MHRSLEKLLGVNGLIKALGKPLVNEKSRYLYTVKLQERRLLREIGGFWKDTVH